LYDKVAYISGPLRASTIEQTEANITAAENEALWWLSNGFAVICPHKNGRDFGQVLNVEKVILAADEELVSRCDIIVMLYNWTTSAGSVRERKRALREDKVIMAKRGGLLNVYRVYSRHSLDMTIGKGKFFLYPSGETLSWEGLLERINL